MNAVKTVHSLSVHQCHSALLLYPPSSTCSSCQNNRPSAVSPLFLLQIAMLHVHVLSTLSIYSGIYYTLGRYSDTRLECHNNPCFFLYAKCLLSQPSNYFKSKRSPLLNSLSDSVPKGSKDDKIWSVMNSEEGDTPHFAEDCRDSDGRLHHVRQGKHGMGLVLVSYLSKINWSTSFPLDLVELKLQHLVTELKLLQYVPR